MTLKAAQFARRELISFHEAGHAVIGFHQGLAVEVIYIGNLGGQVLFAAQWDLDEVLNDPDLLDRYDLMLLASAYVEQRCRGAIVGAESDIATLEAMLQVAEGYGTHPRADLSLRAQSQVAEHWSEIDVLARELMHHSTPVVDLVDVLTCHPELGSSVDELSGVRTRELLAQGSGGAEPAAEMNR